MFGVEPLIKGTAPRRRSERRCTAGKRQM